ncbi:MULTISPECIES: hypothetical protein [Paenibacillus]|uniref:hypothetical protein n=1 Tax=Paenibacillus TaxID=44249 RepID=UPI002041A7C3|nr:hypothetical protein [Paenibacillus camelliae]MCM3634822.1 hypothetical protein [Paenibacillus camelliae]
MSDRNYIHNDHERTDNNGQRKNKVHGGEFRNGRLSQIKNNNPQGEDVPNEFISHRDHE